MVQPSETGSPIPYRKTLDACLRKMVDEGYSGNFKATSAGRLCHLETDKTYPPNQISIVNFYRFEGASNPDDNAILYVIQTADGTKGTLVDAYGAYADPAVAKLIVEVQDINGDTKPM